MIDPIEELEEAFQTKKANPYADLLLSIEAVPEALLGTMLSEDGRIRILSLLSEGDEHIKEATLENMRKEIEETTERAIEDGRKANLKRLEGRVAIIPAG